MAAEFGATGIATVVHFGTPRPTQQLPNMVRTMKRDWVRVDDYYATLDVATSRANKLRANGQRIMILRGMKGTMECYGLYAPRNP